MTVVLDAARRSQMDEAVGVERVAWADRLELEVDAGVGAGGDDAADRRPRRADLEAVLARDALGVGALAHLGRARVQFVGAPHDLDFVGVLELGQRLLELALADEAPRAHDVGPDLDPQNVLAST